MSLSYVVRGCSEEFIEMKNTTNFPPGWNEERVRRVLQHYDSLSEDEAVAEDEAAFEDFAQTVNEE